MLDFTLPEHCLTYYFQPTYRTEGSFHGLNDPSKRGHAAGAPPGPPLPLLTPLPTGLSPSVPSAPSETITHRQEAALLPLVRAAAAGQCWAGRFWKFWKPPTERCWAGRFWKFRKPPTGWCWAGRFWKPCGPLHTGAGTWLLTAPVLVRQQHTLRHKHHHIVSYLHTIFCTKNRHKHCPCLSHHHTRATARVRS